MSMLPDPVKVDVSAVASSTEFIAAVRDRIPPGSVLRHIRPSMRLLAPILVVAAAAEGVITGSWRHLVSLGMVMAGTILVVAIIELYVRRYFVRMCLESNTRAQAIGTRPAWVAVPPLASRRTRRYVTSRLAPDRLEDYDVLADELGLSVDLTLQAVQNL